MNKNLAKLLSGGNLRSIGHVTQVIGEIRNQAKFDDLFQYLFSTNRTWIMRAADAIEKITKIHPEYLEKHKSALFKLLETAIDKELKWHLALILPRLSLSSGDCVSLFVKLSDGAMNSKESKIVRVNCLQGLFELTHTNPKFNRAFRLLLLKLREENIPSLNARINKLTKV